PPHVSVPKERTLNGLYVRRLQALVALHDLEADALTLVQGLVAIHRDRGEMDEHVVPALTLDEPEALLVRKPLDGAFCQRLTPYCDDVVRLPTGVKPAEHSTARSGLEPPIQPVCMRAQMTAFSRRHAIVIGPTPPGTGVRNPAISAAAGSTSPTRPLSVLLMPTSMTAAPGMTMSAVTVAGRPVATTSTSAERVWPARSRVREWQT